MKKALWFAWATFHAVTPAAAICAGAGQPSSAPAFTLKVERGDLVATIGNPNRSVIDIAYPLPLTYGAELGGIELEFRRVGAATKNARRLCASYDEAGIPARRSLAPGGKVEARWNLALLEKIYCLDPGEYVVRATYVDKADNEILAPSPVADAHVRID